MEVVVMGQMMSSTGVGPQREASGRSRSRVFRLRGIAQSRLCPDGPQVGAGYAASTVGHLVSEGIPTTTA